jgi:hypothetical protein
VPNFSWVQRADTGAKVLKRQTIGRRSAPCVEYSCVKDTPAMMASEAAITDQKAAN